MVLNDQIITVDVLFDLQSLISWSNCIISSLPYFSVSSAEHVFLSYLGSLLRFGSRLRPEDAGGARAANVQI